jgi:hypothetical protein
MITGMTVVQNFEVIPDKFNLSVPVHWLISYSKYNNNNNDNNNNNNNNNSSNINIILYICKQ